MCIDEAHSVHLFGDNFREDFPKSVRHLSSLYDDIPSPYKCTRIAMSASFRFDDQKCVFDLWKAPSDFVVWTDMNRRRIFASVFEVDVIANKRGRPAVHFNEVKMFHPNQSSRIAGVTT